MKVFSPNMAGTFDMKVSYNSGIICSAHWESLGVDHHNVLSVVCDLTRVALDAYHTVTMPTARILHTMHSYIYIHSQL